MNNTTQTQTVFTTLSALKAMSEIAPAKEIRSYLVGVYFECNQKSTRLVATDGHCLGVYEASRENQIGGGAINFIMPLDVIKMLKAVDKQCEEITITIEFKHATRLDLITGGTIQVEGGPAITWAAVGGLFPDYIRVLPKTMSGETAQFDPAIVQKFVKVGKFLGLSAKNGVPISHNGNGSALICVGDPNFIGVIMPMRIKPITSIPAQFLTRLV